MKSCPFQIMRCEDGCAAWLPAPGPFKTQCLVLESWAGTARSCRTLADTFGGLSAELAGAGPGLVGKFLKAALPGRKPKPETPVGGDL